VKSTASPVQFWLARRSPARWRVTIDNPPINVVGSELANTKPLVNTGLPPDVAIGAEQEARVALLGRHVAQDGIKALIARRFHRPGNVENRLSYHLGQLAPDQLAPERYATWFLAPSGNGSSGFHHWLSR
jgi:hypothetical protein